MRLRNILTLFASILIAVELIPAQRPATASEPLAASTVESASKGNAAAVPGAVESIADPATGRIAPSENNQINAALDMLTQLLEQYRRSGSLPAQAGTLSAMGSSWNALGQRQKAIEAFQSSLTLYREIGDRRELAFTLSHIGDVYRGWGFPNQAIHYYRDALSIFTQTSDESGKAAVLNNLGAAYLAIRNKRKCFESMNEALALYRAMGDRRGSALELNNLGMAYAALTNDPQKALNLFQEAITGLQLTDDRDSEGIVLENIGAICVRMGQKDLAEASFDHALAMFRRASDAQGEARVQKHLRMLGQSDTVASMQAQAELSH